MKKIRSSNFFDLYEVKDNIFAAIKSNPLAMSNAGFINLGNNVVIFDTFLSIDAAKDLKEMATEITGCKDFIIVNSHFHVDHHLGNSVFPKNSTIISSALARENIIQTKKEIKFGAEYYEEEKKELEERLKNAKSQEEVLDIENSLVIINNLMNDKASIIPPNLAFEEKLIIYGEHENLLLEVMKVAHSPGDIVGILEKSKVAFLGDLLTVNQHPFLGTGDPFKLKDQLKHLFEYEIDVIVPGHGEITNKEKIIEMIDYIDSIISLVKNNMDKADQLTMSDLPSRFQSYEGPAFRWNIDFLKEFLKNE